MQWLRTYIEPLIEVLGLSQIFLYYYVFDN